MRTAKGTRSPLDYAYRLLGRRAYSTAGLVAKMRASGFSPHAVARTAARLSSQGYLNDARMAAALTERFQARGFGPAAIRQKLVHHQLDSPLIEQTLDARQPALELEAARKLLASRFPADALQQAKTYARALRLLLRRGYSYELAKQLLGRPPRDEPEDEQGVDDLM